MYIYPNVFLKQISTIYTLNDFEVLFVLFFISYNIKLISMLNLLKKNITKQTLKRIQCVCYMYN